MCDDRRDYDSRSINRARLIERLIAGALNAVMVGSFLVVIKLLGL